MKKLLFILSIAAISCCSTGKSGNSSTDTSKKDTLISKNGKEFNYETDSSIPVCMKMLINKFKAEEKQNPPRCVYRYQYNGKTVYYVPAICCDFFSDLYDENCTIIAHPDGGFTGRGDGKAADFTTVKTAEKLIWKDNR